MRREGNDKDVKTKRCPEGEGSMYTSQTDRSIVAHKKAALLTHAVTPISTCLHRVYHVSLRRRETVPRPVSFALYADLLAPILQSRTRKFVFPTEVMT